MAETDNTTESKAILLNEDNRYTRYLPFHLVEAEMWDELCDLLIESNFLEEKLKIIEGNNEKITSLPAIFEIFSDFEKAILALPDDYVKREQVSKMFNLLKVKQTAIIPPDLGSVGDLYIPVSMPKAVIFHVQDVFSNLQGRKYMVNILDKFLKEHKTKLVFVEGGSGNVSLTDLREKASPEKRIEVAEKYLENLKISPEEYLDIISDYPLVLWGVEDKELYDKHHQSFLETNYFKERLEPVLLTLHQTINKSKERLQNSTVAQIETKILANQKKELGLADFSNFLLQTAKQNGIDTEKCPNLINFVNLVDLEKSIDWEKANHERITFIKDIAKRMQNNTDIQELIDKTNYFKMGKISSLEYYTIIENFASGLGTDIDTYPSFSYYTTYLKNRDLLNTAQLLHEIDYLIELLRVTLVPNLKYRDLVIMEIKLQFIEKAFSHNLTPVDYKRFCSLHFQGIAATWFNLLKENLPGCSLEIEYNIMTELEEKIPNIKQEYDIAQLREDAMIQNIISKLADTGEKTAILITGGYHTQRIAEGLKKCDIGLLVVRPKISQLSDHKLYISILKEQQSSKKIQLDPDG